MVFWGTGADRVDGALRNSRGQGRWFVGEQVRTGQRNEDRVMDLVNTIDESETKD